jgi:hypothetical protein
LVNWGVSIENENQMHKGILDDRDYNRTNNQIRNTVQSHFCLDDYEEAQRKVEVPKVEQVNANDVLTKIYNKYSRRNPVLAKEANDFLLEINQHNFNKKTKVGFDAAGRRERDLQDRVAAFLNKVKELEGDNLESIIERVITLIAETVPPFECIKEAYGLLITRGFKSKHIENLLELEGKVCFDTEAIITAVEEIESYIPLLRK